jgi:hypothetical protein
VSYRTLSGAIPSAQVKSEALDHKPEPSTLEGARAHREHVKAYDHADKMTAVQCYRDHSGCAQCRSIVQHLAGRDDPWDISVQAASKLCQS